MVDLEASVTGGQDALKPELRLWLRLLSTTKLISHEIRRRLRTEFDATLPQFDLMAQLYKEPDGLRLSDLSRRTMVTNGNITGLVDRLVAAGLVLRETPGADRRVTVARLTPRGTELFARMAHVHESWLRDLMADVDSATRSALMRDVGILKRSVGGHMPDHGESPAG